MTETQPIHHENKEPLKPAESIQTPQFDAILVHGYWMTDKTIRKYQKDGTISEKHITAPALRTHFAARAAALAWDEGRGAGKIVIDLGHLWGPDYPPEGRVVADTLVNKYHVPREAITLREEAYSTGGEVKTFLELAKENGWTNVLDVASKWHHLTIRKLYDGADLNVEFKSIQDVLKNDDKRVKRKLSRLGRARPLYPLYEFGKWAVMHKPGFNYETLEEANKKARTEPGQDVKGSPIQIVDISTLPPKEEAKAA